MRYVQEIFLRAVRIKLLFLHQCKINIVLILLHWGHTNLVTQKIFEENCAKPEGKGLICKSSDMYKYFTKLFYFLIYS